MSLKQKIIASAAVLGLLVGFVDAVLDYYFFYEGPFLDLLIRDVPHHEIYIRGIILIVFVVFGSILARTVHKLQVAHQEKETLVADLQRALSEIKTLSGFLPICASCKRIRDDSGYWNQIETYLQKHSQAEFTHSLCPECVKTLYPDLEIEADTSLVEAVRCTCTFHDSAGLQVRKLAVEAAP